jgi:hypothetical protein
MKVDRSDPFVWGGRVIEEEGTMEGREVVEGNHWYSEPLPLPPGVSEEVAVPLGELRLDTEAPAVPRGSLGGRIWGVITGGSDG